MTDVYHDSLDALCKQLGAAVDAGHYLRVVVFISKERELDTFTMGGMFDPETAGKRPLLRKGLMEMKSL